MLCFEMHRAAPHSRKVSDHHGGKVRRVDPDTGLDYHARRPREIRKEGHANDQFVTPQNR